MTLVCDFNQSGLAFETVAREPLPPCDAEAIAVLVEKGEIVRAICAEHGDLARDEHPGAVEYCVERVSLSRALPTKIAERS